MEGINSISFGAGADSSMSLSRERNERRPTGLVLADLTDISALAERLDVESSAADFDVGLTTDDL